MRGKTRLCMKQIQDHSWEWKRAARGSALELRVLEYSDLDSSNIEKGLENESSSNNDVDVLA